MKLLTLTGVRNSGKTHLMLQHLATNENSVLLVSNKIEFNVLKSLDEFCCINILTFNEYLQLTKYSESNFAVICIYNLETFIQSTLHLNPISNTLVLAEHNGLSNHYNNEFNKGENNEN